jgi:hypothetical protein
MKKNLVGLVAGSLFFGSQALGAFTSAELIMATEKAVADFETENPDHAAHFTGFKSWKSGDDGKVKIYVDHNGHAMEFNYQCQKQDNELECQAS